MKRLPLLLTMVAVCVFLTIRSLGTGPATPPSKYERILQTVGEMIRQGHYSPKDMNDDFSRRAYAKYFEAMDPEKNIFLQEDLKALSRHETRIDDEVKGAPVEFFLDVSKVFNKRIEAVSKMQDELLSKPFDFTVNETYTADPKKVNYPKTLAEQRETIRKKLKYMVLERFVELQEAREKNKDTKDFVVKTDAELEAEARDRVRKVMTRVQQRFTKTFDDDKRFALYVNTITQLMDPYTEFFPPVEKRYFDEQLSGTFSGIGASLQYDEGNIKIATLLTGSPAWKSKQVEVGDIILKVGQGKDSAQDITGFEVEDAVKLIRGKQGTDVTLTLKKKDGTLQRLTLTRDKIQQDEVYARSAVVDQGGEKIGYIYLPEFYADFDNPNGRRCAVDVAEEVKKLKAAKVDGIVIDLRNNGGGSLYDVVQMAGLFIEDGPIVQVRDRQGRPMVMRDKDQGVLYDGPLAVMVNEFSASASEIFAAAIQDYNRGVIIGSTSTYGKGTVQRAISLDQESNFLNQNPELGSLKITLQKFYRVNGGATQLKGVVPDVVVPDQYETFKYRERDNDNALPWDEISKAQYKTWDGGYDIQTIKNLSSSRISSNPVFQQIRRNTAALDRRNDKEFTLQIDKYKAEQKELRLLAKQTDSLIKANKEMQITYLPEDKERMAQDKNKEERYNAWLKDRSRDIYLDQAVKVIGDIRNQQALARGKKEDKPVKTF
ncbi:tail-specific protease [Flaviaesturariibacter flavus]|uniref:Tail-specific protease n=1 Tax=Flaviaesturariibacter flavus TaxID=2502780 RepID=A0A4R1BP59_9BACT|nr:carboxy terminal-processing peptidase [Flaviaesturariibacter flavus]TCJ19238.1 tail-specific protease [Flaviaesturariibacter flavus]